MRSIWKIGRVQILSRVWTKFGASKRFQKNKKKKSNKLFRCTKPQKQHQDLKPFVVSPAECQLRENGKKTTWPSEMTEYR
jgi:hypothetical protein